MELEQLMEELGRELEAPLSAELPGVYSLPLDEGVAIVASKTGEGILLFSQLGKVPARGREALFQELLHANLFGQGTSFAILGLTDDGQSVTLSYLIAEKIDYAAFSELLEQFVATLDFWRSELVDRAEKP